MTVDIVVNCFHSMISDIVEADMKFVAFQND